MSLLASNTGSTEDATLTTALSSWCGVTVNQNLTLNVSLQLGSASEAIEVTAQAPALSTEDAVTGQNLNRTFINDLPLVGRSVFDLALLAHGNQPSGNTFGANNMANNWISDGSRNAHADILIDGVSTVAAEQNSVQPATHLSRSPHNQ